MSNVIRFLEKLGSDATLRYAEPSQLDAAMLEAGLDEKSRHAIVASDHRQLEKAVDAETNVCAIIFHVEPDEDEGDGDRKLRRHASS
jgi:hypothetical protein